MDNSIIELPIPSPAYIIIHVIFFLSFEGQNTIYNYKCDLDSLEIIPTLQQRCIKGVADENQGKLSDGDDDLCPVDCVREFKTDEEFLKILEKDIETNSLVVVDFYCSSCGSCKYIEQGVSNYAKVLDEYDEQSEVAERLRIRAVPLFHFYKNGVLLEASASKDKERSIEAIKKYRMYLESETVYILPHCFALYDRWPCLLVHFQLSVELYGLDISAEVAPGRELQGYIIGVVVVYGKRHAMNTKA
ncbi:hypothetical protein V6N11_003510 [Hibiscus sabdariffa]|uniref:Thioredoxin domain-containing protein n=1 Tax=Hibiscus sabdariffa TaxID=183260 RepID=A0ABR2SEC8_9ROSI